MNPPLKARQNRDNLSVTKSHFVILVINDSNSLIANSRLLRAINFDRQLQNGQQYVANKPFLPVQVL